MLLLDIVRMRHIYFKKDVIEDTNYVIKKTVMKIKEDLKLKDNEYNEEIIMERLNSLISSISDCQNELE